MAEPLHITFLGCGFITRVHSRHLKALRDDIVCSYASRDAAKAEAYCREFQGCGSYPDYGKAIEDPRVHAVVVAVPRGFTGIIAFARCARQHGLSQKPAFRGWDSQAAVEPGSRQARSRRRNDTTTSRGYAAIVTGAVAMARWCSRTSRRS